MTSTGGPYNDGVWHTAILTVGAEGTRLYVDGALRATHPSTRFFANVRDLNGCGSAQRRRAGSPVALQR